MNQTDRSGRRLPPLHALRAFEAAARHGSITHAANELHVTHSAVSHQVKALEAHLGVSLIQRQGRGIVLTSAGQAYHLELEAAFDRIAQATERVAGRQPRLSLTINTTASLATRWLIPRLASFCKLHPGIDVRLVTSESRLDFNPQMYDASIRCLHARELQSLRRRRDWEDVDMQPFLDETSFPVCSPVLMHDKPMRDLNDLRLHALLHSRSSQHAWREWLCVAGAAAIDASIGVTFDNAHFALQAAARGLGIAIGTGPLTQEELDNGTLVKPFPGIEGRAMHYYVICPASEARSRPDATAFRDWLLAVA